MRSTTYNCHTVTIYKKGYKKKATDNLRSECTDKDELELLHIQVALLLNSFAHTNKTTLPLLYDTQQSLAKVTLAAVNLRKVLVGMQDKQYINKNITKKLENFYDNDPEFNLNADIAQLLLNHEVATFNQSTYKKYRPSLRHLFLYFDVLEKFTTVFNLYLYKYLSLNVVSETKLVPVDYKVKVDGSSYKQQNDIIYLVKEEVSRRFGLNEPIFKVYTSIEDMLLETK
jgi:hypothetical protein